MAEYLIQSEDLVAIADKIRVLSGTEDAMSLDDIQTKIGDANVSIEAALNALASKGVNIPDGANISDIADLISSVEAGNTDIEDSLVARTLTSYTNDKVTSIGSNAFYRYSDLIEVNFPAATIINSSAFNNCSNLTTAIFPALKTIGNSAFYNCSKLATISFPIATTISNNAFYKCSNLITASFPAATNIGSYAFINCYGLMTVNFQSATVVNTAAFSACSNLTTAIFPTLKNVSAYTFCNCSKLSITSFDAVTNIYDYAFTYCSQLTTISFPAATAIGSCAFSCCYRLMSLYLMGSSLCTLLHSNAFISSPIGGYSTYSGAYGSIYVPTSLLTSYKTATNWTYFSSRFVGI